MGATSNGAAISTDFPVWIPSLPKENVSGILPVVSNDGKSVLLIFSTKEKCRAYLDASGTPTEYVARPIEDSLAMFGLLVLLEKKGTAYVSLDPIGQNEITVQQIAKIREAIERAIG